MDRSFKQGYGSLAFSFPTLWMGRRLQSDSSESWMLASVFVPHCLLNTNCITWYPRYFCWRLEINFQLPGRGLDVGIIWWSIATTLSGANGSHLDLWLWKKCDYTICFLDRNGHNLPQRIVGLIRMILSHSRLEGNICRKPQAIWMWKKLPTGKRLQFAIENGA